MACSILCNYYVYEYSIEALRCLLFHGDGGHIGGKNCIESMEAALQYGRHHHGKSKQPKASICACDTCCFFLHAVIITTYSMDKAN